MSGSTERILYRDMATGLISYE